MTVASYTWKTRLLPRSEELVETWLNGAQVVVRLSSSRLSKQGDFRVPRNGRPSMITINHDLHPVEFLITFCHELAHYRVWKRYGRRITPHGPEWKDEFRRMLIQLLESDILDPAVAKAVFRCYFKRESIGSGACEQLYRAIGKAGEASVILRVADLPEGDEFRLRNGRIFTKGPRARSRYRCTEKRTGRIFAVHPMAEIVVADNDNPGRI